MSSETTSNVEVIKDVGDITYKMFTFLASLVTLKLSAMGESLFVKHYMPLVLAVVMVYFLIWIFYTLVSLHHTTITTLFPISVLYGIICTVSFAAFRIISPNTYLAIFNLTLWLFVFIVIAFIYYQNPHAATYGSELPLVNGDGNILAPQQLESVAGQPPTEHKLDIGGDESPPPSMTGFDRDSDGMVDLEENRVVTMETDAR